MHPVKIVSHREGRRWVFRIDEGGTTLNVKQELRLDDQGKALDRSWEMARPRTIERWRLYAEYSADYAQLVKLEINAEMIVLGDDGMATDKSHTTLSYAPEHDADERTWVLAAIPTRFLGRVTRVVVPENEDDGRGFRWGDLVVLFGGEPLRLPQSVAC